MIHSQPAGVLPQQAEHTMCSWRVMSLQEELATVTARQHQLTASEDAAQQQLSAALEAYEKASTACASADGEMHRLSAALEDSEAQLQLAQQKEGQVRPYVV